jgi:hypothetical protein
VEGASDSSLHFRRKRFGTSRAPSTTLRVVPLPRYRGADARSRSRGAPLRPSYSHATVRKPFVPPFFSRMILSENRNGTFRDHAKKKGGGAPKGAPLVPPRRRKKSLPAMRRALHSPLPALARKQVGGALAFRRPTAVMRRGFYPSTRFRAALPGITGFKRENPLRHQCSQHLAVRSRAGRSMPETARICSVSPHLREPPPPRLRSTLAKASFRGRDS